MSASRDERAAYRRFVRDNHPDVGGDPAAFVAGLAEFGRGDQTDARFDAPIVVVPAPSRMHRLTYRVRRWWHRRNAPPRVR